MNKEYEIPQEIKDLFEEADALEDCRDASVRNFFGYRRAIKYSKESVRKSRKAWNMIYEIYPELRNKKLTYSWHTGMVSFNE